jgi:hypothetical protein
MKTKITKQAPGFQWWLQKKLQCADQKQEALQLPVNTDNWVPACGGSEKPFKTRTGRTLWYMWNKTTGEHAYLDVDNDKFLENDEVNDAFGM